jgi:hypothetical protein
MLIQTAFVVALAGGTVGLALADSPAQPQTTQVAVVAPVAQELVTATTSTPAAAPTLKPGNSIVVHRDTRAADAHDSRVDVGGVRVSAASPVIIEDKDGNPHELLISAGPLATDGAIAIPDNTIGPGEPFWSIRDRESAARKIAEAQADIARSDAQRSPGDYSYSYPSYNGYGWLGGLNTWGTGYSYRNDGLRGPVTTTITRFDDLGSTAQRAYSDAAYPRLNGSQDARDRAVSQFGRDSLPPIGPTQDAVDRAHNAANHENPRPPEPNQTPRK